MPDDEILLILRNSNAGVPVFLTILLPTRKTTRPQGANDEALGKNPKGLPDDLVHGQRRSNKNSRGLECFSQSTRPLAVMPLRTWLLRYQRVAAATRDGKWLRATSSFAESIGGGCARALSLHAYRA